MSGADADTSAALLAADGGTSTANSATGSSAAAAPPTVAKSEASSAGEKGACCPEGSIGRVEANPDVRLAGRVHDLNGVHTYITGDVPGAAPGVALVVAHDIFGPDSGRTKQICDRLARTLGVLVVLPDFFHGSPPMPNSPGPHVDVCRILVHMFCCGGCCKLLCCNRNIRWAAMDRLFGDCVLSYLQREHKVARVAVFGFCWGGWFATHAASRDEVCAVASVHPSLQPTAWAGDNVEELVAEMGVPTMMLAAGNDLDNVKSGGLMHAALRDAGVGDADLHFQEFAGMKHGWVNRGDLDDTATARDVEIALNLVEGFMRKHLLGGGEGGGEGKGVGAGGGGSGGGAAAGD